MNVEFAKLFRVFVLLVLTVDEMLHSRRDRKLAKVGQWEKKT